MKDDIKFYVKKIQKNIESIDNILLLKNIFLVVELELNKKPKN